MPVSPLWSFLFFVMLITLGLDSQFTMTDTVTTAVLDQWPRLRRHKGRVVIVASVLCFLLGLSLCSRGGIFMFDLINAYSAWWSVLTISVTELVIIMYAYGHKRVMADIAEMSIAIPTVIRYYWLSCWMVITPLVLSFILVMTLVEYSPTSSARRPDTEEDKYVFPVVIQALGWMMATVGVIIIPITAVVQVYKRYKAGKSFDIRSMMSPNEKWGPAGPPVQ